MPDYILMSVWQVPVESICHLEQHQQVIMFQCKIDEIFNNMPNVFGIVDDIMVRGYDKNGADHDEAVYSVLRQCQDVNLKLNKEKCDFRCTSIPFFGKVVSRKGILTQTCEKVRALTDMPVPKKQKGAAGFPWYN